MVQLVPLDLPAPRDEPLPRSPLRLVAFQVRHSTVANLGDISVGLRLQEVLGAGEWRLEQLQAQTVTLTASTQERTSPTVELQPNGWRLHSLDARANVTLMPDSIGVETTAYPGWRPFSSILHRVVEVASEIAKPQAETRLGLRYINRIDDPSVSTPRAWRRWIREDVLGMICHPVGDHILGIHQQASIDAGDEMQAVVQHGFTREPASGQLTYVIDLDTYREGVRRFDISSIQLGTDKLHRLALQLFQSVITDTMYEHLKG